MFLWVHVIIVTVAYSANLTAFLTVERIPEGITSLKQLYDSKLFVYGIGGPFFADNMAESGNEYVRVSNTNYDNVIIFVVPFPFGKETKNVPR